MKCEYQTTTWPALGKRMCARLYNSSRTPAGKFAMLLLALFILTACQQQEVTDTDVKVIDDVGVVELLEASQHVVIVDVRPDYRYRLGHLPGAINIPLPDLKPEDARFKGAKHAVVYGDGPGNALSHAAAKKLLAGGELSVHDFRGGLAAWKKAGRDVVTPD